MDSSQQPTNAFDDPNSTPSQPEAEQAQPPAPDSPGLTPLEIESEASEVEADQAQPPAPDSPASTPLEIESEASEIEADQAQPPAPDFASEAEPVATPALESELETEPLALSEPDFEPEMADFEDSDLDSPWDVPEATVMSPQQPTVQSKNLPFSEAQVPAKSMNFGLLINRIIAIAIFIYGAIAVISLLN